MVVIGFYMVEQDDTYINESQFIFDGDLDWIRDPYRETFLDLFTFWNIFYKSKFDLL
jgi:hypothetical protein